MFSDLFAINYSKCFMKGVNEKCRPASIQKCATMYKLKCEVGSVSEI
jgi:hypothetical protein